MIEAVITPSATSPTKIVETAFISGVTPSLTIEYIFIGSVVEPGPDAKACDDQIIKRQGK